MLNERYCSNLLCAVIKRKQAALHDDVLEVRYCALALPAALYLNSFFFRAIMMDGTYCTGNLIQLNTQKSTTNHEWRHIESSISICQDNIESEASFSASPSILRLHSCFHNNNNYDVHNASISFDVHFFLCSMLFFLNRCEESFSFPIILIFLNRRSLPIIQK